MKKANYKALLPIGVFLVLYLGLGIVFEYVMKISMGFYNIPIVVVFLAALLVACFQNPDLKFDDKLEVMAKGISDKNIITMILIFLTAGIFVGVVGRSSAESVAYFLLSLVPARFAVLVLFVVSAFIALSIGTSVGTITLIVPIAAAVANESGFALPLCVGSVVGGAMFGDNLSFISDTTIAACNGQGCEMKDKFRENFGIALPAAIVTMVIIFIKSQGVNTGEDMSNMHSFMQVVPYLLLIFAGIMWDVVIAFCERCEGTFQDTLRKHFKMILLASVITIVIILVIVLNVNAGENGVEGQRLLQVVPYLLVLFGGIAGANVFVVLLMGIVCGGIIMIATGAATVTDMLSNMGSGVSGMFETAMVAILVSAICALIDEYGGFEALLALIKRVFRGQKGGKLGMGLLVGAMDIATANNTVAIVMANPIAKEMADNYDISPRKAASILDTFSCIFQGIIPYGAQMLMAVMISNQLGYEVSAFQIIPNLFYPYMLLISMLVFVFLVPDRKK